MNPPVLDWLRGQTDAMVETLERLVRAESPSDVPARSAAAVVLLVEELATLGYRSLVLPGRATGGCLVARPVTRRKRAPIQLLVGHVDTVWPVGSDLPIGRDDDRFTGPGAYDMKAGLVQALFALRALRALELTPEVEPVLLFNTDEEIGSRESGRHIGRLARIADRAFVLEPSAGPDGRLKTARKGIGRYEIVVHGRAAHAGLDPGAGASAILELSHQIQSLFALNDPARGVTVNVGTIDGGLRPNVVAPEARAVVDVRVPTAVDAERVDTAIRGLAAHTPGCSLTVTGGIGRPPMEPERGRALWERAQRLGASLGLDLDQASVGGASDGNRTSQLTPTLDGLGPVGDGAHARHEHVLVHTLPERAALLALLLLSPPLEAR